MSKLKNDILFHIFLRFIYFIIKSTATTLLGILKIMF